MYHDLTRAAIREETVHQLRKTLEYLTERVDMVSEFTEDGEYLYDTPADELEQYKLDFYQQVRELLSTLI